MAAVERLEPADEKDAHSKSSGHTLNGRPLDVFNWIKGFCKFSGRLQAGMFLSAR
jgi:hypothetical protein